MPSNDELKRLLEIASGEGEVDYSKEEETEIHQFLAYFGFKSGDVRYNKAFIEALWLSWTKNPLHKSKFRVQLNKLIKNTESSYFLDEESFVVPKEELLKYVGKIILKRNMNVWKRKKEEKESNKV